MGIGSGRRRGLVHEALVGVGVLQSAGVRIHDGRNGVDSSRWHTV